MNTFQIVWAILAAQPVIPAKTMPAKENGPIQIPNGCAFLGVVEEFKWANGVCLNAYSIDKTEVTVEAYQRCVDAGTCRPACSGRSSSADCPPHCNAAWDSRRNHPVNCVTYTDAATYCAWNNQRLPTRAEWERAAERRDIEHERPLQRPSPKPVESPLASKVSRSDVSTQPACSDPRDVSNAGVCDMAGSLAEWISDWYWDIGSYNTRKWFRDRTDKEGRVHDPTPPSCRGKACDQEGFRVQCQGAEVAGISYLFCDRQMAHPWYALPGVGFRCITVPQTADNMRMKDEPAGISRSKRRKADTHAARE